MRYKYLIFSCLVFIGLASCKKEKVATNTTIVGKWYRVKQVAVLSHNGIKLDSVNKTSFTNADFVQYYGDGSGYYSDSFGYFTNDSAHPGISEFTYTLKGTSLTEFRGGANDTGIPETITSLTSNGLGIHVVLQILDPNDPSKTDTEVDDLTYIK